MRKYGVSPGDIGDGVTFGEAYDLVVAAMGDTATPLYAAVQGWAFPASFPELVQLASSAGSPDAARKLMPWTLGAENRRREALSVSTAERAEALAELQAMFA
ncbi:hypothetical protein C7K25_15545 [Gulosibacter molinativorax]|uniref:Uncharacterized protein n=2 Tax=Gulosibacter molinativorax TaxID=256821 RepID=A0ABT7CC66_9MICO|nr:hypothetical protein [Gulosibacter molinativorax]QUY60898.1 Hypotetical protein [Gulosibacter molinativorax]